MFPHVNFVKPQKALQELVQGWWSISMTIIHDWWLRTRVLFRELRRLFISLASCDACLYLWGMVRLWLELDIMVVHRTTGYECSGGPTLFLVVSDHRTTISRERCTRQLIIHFSSTAAPQLHNLTSSTRWRQIFVCLTLIDWTFVKSIYYIVGCGGDFFHMFIPFGYDFCKRLAVYRHMLHWQCN